MSDEQQRGITRPAGVTVPAAVDKTVAQALVMLPWDGVDSVRAELRLTPEALALVMAERPELLSIEMVRGVPFSVVESPPTSDDWSIRCVLVLSERYAETSGYVGVLLDT